MKASLGVQMVLKSLMLKELSEFTKFKSRKSSLSRTKGIKALFARTDDVVNYVECVQTIG